MLNLWSKPLSPPFTPLSGSSPLSPPLHPSLRPFTPLFLGQTMCTLKFPDPDWYWDTVTKICVFIFAFIIPVMVITICYGLMILRLRSVRLLSGSKEKDRNMRRITRMVLVIVAAFIICWTPIHIFIIIKTLVEIDSGLVVMFRVLLLSCQFYYVKILWVC